MSLHEELREITPEDARDAVSRSVRRPRREERTFQELVNDFPGLVMVTQALAERLRSNGIPEDEERLLVEGCSLGMLALIECADFQQIQEQNPDNS